ncbi:MAG TPA: flagellar hook-basal body protein [Candidatus Methylacidiphilales bacterium]|jgi:flagellar hook protein FlgE|nr:flagellar hook-basal body protein [Candidatus Methylacidiphilales bacterium]
MIQSLFSGVSGMLANQTEMDVIGDNIANANTDGYKASNADFESSFEQVTSAATINNPVGLAVGLGVNVGSTTTNFSQGVFQTTNVPTDMGINGNGWFTVQTVGGTDLLTRDGDFIEDSSGYLRTPDGAYLMGVMGTTAPTTPTAGTPPDQIQIPASITGIGGAATPVVSFAVDSTGAITATGQDGSTATIGYITLQSFSNNNGLVDLGNNYYQYAAAAGTNQYYQASQAGAGTIQTGVLEASNVDLSTEFANMIIAQRGFEASARVITVSDDMLQTVTNLKQQ